MTSRRFLNNGVSDSILNPKTYGQFGEVVIVNVLKKALPKPVRTLLRVPLYYTQRLGRWGVILWQVRGIDRSNHLKLVGSACAGVLTSLKNLSKWEDPLLLWDAVVDVRNVGKFQLRKHCDDLWHVLPWREDTVFRVLRNQLKTGDCFVDAGANIGVYTVLAATLVGSEGEVIAVEMIPQTAARLRSHIVLNQLENVVVIEQALSNVDGLAVVAMVPTGRYGQATIVEGISTNGTEVLVTTTTLERILENIEVVNLMKMDLEGAERMALEGAGGSLEKVRAIIFEEWSDTGLTAFLEQRGFFVKRLDGNNHLAQR